MQSVRKTGLILLLVFLLPAIFYSAYEISSLNRNEEVLKEIYQNQLDAILFSINQYADDVINSWATKMESALSRNQHPELYQLINLSPGMSYIFVTDSLTVEPQLFTSERAADTSRVKREIRSAIMSNMEEIRRLFKYKESGFQKISPFITGDTTKNLMLMFIMDDPYKGQQIGGMLVLPDIFIRETLRPKFQTIAQDKFIISAYKAGVNNPVYTTQDTTEMLLEARALTKDCWILPDHYIGIALKGKSIDDVVKERTYFNMALLLLLNIVLVLAIYLVFRNVKKEIQLAQNKSDFVSNVSHEIRTPLALISMFAETLEMGRVGSQTKRQQYYRIISKETARLTAIVNKILNFSKIEARKGSFHFEQVDLNDIVGEIIDTYEYHMESKGFNYYVEKDGELFVKADREAIQAMLVNVLDNAIKYSDQHKRIEIKTGRNGYMAYISIRDFGIGIAQHDQRHIFDKFYRVSSGNLAKSKGTGLGLSFVKHIVDAHQGSVEVDSKVGKGTTFTIYLPLIESENV